MLAALAAILSLGANPPCGELDLGMVLGLAAARSDEVAVRRAELASAGADQALAGALRILPGTSATLLAGPAPRARGDVVSSPDSNRSLDGLRPFWRVDLQLTQPLYTWGRIDAAAQAADAGARARSRLVESTTGEVQLRVVQLYWGASLARRLLAVAAEVEKALDAAERHVDAALAEGDGQVLLSDRYRVALYRAALQGRVAEARRGLELARAGLAATLGVAPERLALREAPLDPSPGPPPDEPAAFAAAQRQRSDLRALDEAIAARRAEADAERAAMRPQLFLAGTLSYGQAPNRDRQTNPWVRDEFNLLAAGVAVGLRQDLGFPLLQARARKAEAEQSVLERQREALSRAVEVQVAGALADLRGARGRLVAARAALESGRALFRSAGLDFAAGVVEARSLLEGYALYVESQAGAAQAAYDLLVAEARLGQVTGAIPREEVRCQLP